ncbi:uncharacterized protein LOC143150747 isoform X3 [Ptiloglossa arizonensis]|uniref:uncharacterized protein LOC143150747 isoform X3 n=1 Tax=Ptiloglossa arizonensis TaxID=3350558 RepID=UPI003F9F7BC3
MGNGNVVIRKSFGARCLAPNATNATSGFASSFAFTVVPGTMVMGYGNIIVGGFFKRRLVKPREGIGRILRDRGERKKVEPDQEGS